MYECIAQKFTFSSGLHLSAMNCVNIKRHKFTHASFTIYHLIFLFYNNSKIMLHWKDNHKFHSGSDDNNQWFILLKVLKHNVSKR